MIEALKYTVALQRTFVEHARRGVVLAPPAAGDAKSDLRKPITADARIIPNFCAKAQGGILENFNFRDMCNREETTDYVAPTAKPPVAPSVAPVTGAAVTG